MKRHLLLAPLLASVLGCGSDDEPFTATKGSSLTEPENIRTWTNSASAYAVYAHAYEPFAVADGEHTYPDALCPVVEDDGTTLTIGGACTDTSGESWVGTATVVRSANGNRALTLDGFGSGTGDDPATKTGEAHLRRIDDTHTDFDLDVTHEGGLRTTLEYSGRIEGGYSGQTVWNGSGTVTRDGLFEPTGSVEVTTVDEVIDTSVCSAPLSGNTTITNAADETVVVTYDGAVDCDTDDAASYTLDGKPQGKLTGISCSVGPGRAGETPWALAALLAGAAGMFRRRRDERGLGTPPVG